MSDHPIPRLPSITTILAATDFSDGSAAALRWAVAIAGQHAARLELFHAIDAAPMESVALDIQREVDARLDEATKPARAAGVEITVHARPGRPWEAIAEREREIGADLIVMGSRGRTHLARLRFGSVADRVVRTARGPVLSVPPDDAGPDRLEHVLVPVDLSAESLAAAQAAKRLLAGAAEHGRLTLLYACDLPFDYGIAISANVIAQARDDDVEHAQRELKQIADRLGNERLAVDVLARPGYAASVVQEEAERLGVDLVALGTHGRSGLGRLLLGSVAGQVLHHAPCPVLTVRRSTDDSSEVDAAAVSTGDTEA